MRTHREPTIVDLQAAVRHAERSIAMSVIALHPDSPEGSRAAIDKGRETLATARRLIRGGISLGAYRMLAERFGEVA